MRYVLLSLLPLLAAADFPTVEKLPASKDLPDPLTMLDGTKVKTADVWNKQRRPELKQLFQHYVYGQFPPAPKAVEGKILHEDKMAFGGKATLREIALTVSDNEKAPKIHLLLVVPNSKSPSPVFVGMNFQGNHALVDDKKVRLPDGWTYKGQAKESDRGTAKDVWAIDQSIERGYAVATFFSADVNPDRKEGRGGVAPFVDKDEKAGTIALWAWGIHRAIDYLTTLKEIDSKRICCTGHSRNGKTALLAAAFDERIALAIPHQAGCGGTAPSRDWIKDWVNKYGDRVETVARINTSFPHWFNAEFKKFNDAPERLPIDQNCLAALVAPRPLLFTNAAQDVWANPAGQFANLKSAHAVYKLLGVDGLVAKEMPKEGELSDGALGYFIRAGTHSMTRADWKVFLDYADLRLVGKQAEKEVRAKKKLLLVSQGPDGHPKNTHEYVAGLRILAELLKKTPGVEITSVRADGKWADGPELIDRADGVVLFLAEGAKWASADEQRLAALKRVQKRGGGLSVLHWGMGAKEEGPIKEFVALFGGCHGGPDRKYKVLETKATIATKDHPATRGLGAFEVKDEFYYKLKFPKQDDGVKVTPLLKVTIDDEEHVVAWAAEAGKGRSFGFSGLHFHDNWKLPQYRRLVAQGVLWTVRVETPKDGLDVTIDEKSLKLP